MDLAERSAECRSILHYVDSSREWSAIHLLIADYAQHVRELPVAIRSQYDAILRERLAGQFDPEWLPEHMQIPAGIAQTDVAVIAIIEEEWDALERVFGLADSDPDYVAPATGRKYFRIDLPSGAQGPQLRVVLCAVGKSRSGPTRAAMRELDDRYMPASYVLAGIAAGIKRRVERGDIVIPATVWDYEGGQVTPAGLLRRTDGVPSPELTQMGGFYYRPERGRRDEILRQALELLSSTDLPRGLDVASFSPKLEARDRIILSGEKLERNQFKALADLTADTRVLGLDMESSAFAQCAGSRPWTVIRSISDFGELNSEPGWKLVAAATAAATAMDYLSSSFSAPRSGPTAASE